MMTIHPDVVGIDVSKHHLDVFDAAHGRGERLLNAAEPIEALVRRWAGQERFVVFEATGRYDGVLCRALETAKVAYARVNPAQARDFARAAGFLAKTDALAARMLAVLGAALRRVRPLPSPRAASAGWSVTASARSSRAAAGRGSPWPTRTSSSRRAAG